MTKREQLAYIAGLMDGEAYFGVKKSKAYKCQGRVTPGYHARIQVRMVDEQAIAFIATTLGEGWYYKEKPHSAKGRPLYCYQASDAAAERILRQVLPFLTVKKEQAETILRLRKLQATSQRHKTKVVGEKPFPNRYGTVRMVAVKCLSDEYVGQCEEAYLACKRLNKVGI